MATLKPTLTLASSDAFASNNISMSQTVNLTVAAPMTDISTVLATATGSESIIVPSTTAIFYLYVKHTGTTDGSTSSTQLVSVETTANEEIARLGAGEFMFIPFNHAAADVGIQLHVQHASEVLMEYMYFTKG